MTEETQAHNCLNLTREEKEEFLLNEINKGLGLDNDFFDKVREPIFQVKLLFDTHGKFNNIKDNYFKRDKTERLKYLELVSEKFLLLSKKLDVKDFLLYIQKNIEQVERKEFEKDHLSIFSDRLRLDYEKPIAEFIKTTLKLFDFLEIENNINTDNNTSTPAEPEKKPLAKKINWKKDPEILKEHLEKLKVKVFISYDNIDAVMSGDEMPVFIKHKTGIYKSTQNNATALFRAWQNNGFIADYLFKEKNQDTGEDEEKESHNYICNSFYRGKKENDFKYNSLKNNANDPSRKSKIDDIENYFKKILTA